MAVFKSRRVRAVLLEWLAYGMAFGALALIGACHTRLSEQADSSIALSAASQEPASERLTDVETPTDVIDALVPEPDFSEGIRADYNALDLTALTVPEQSIEQDPVAIVEALFSAQEPMEGRYSESSEAEVGQDRAVVLFTQDYLPDDSVQSIRTRAEFEQVDGAWKLVWAGEQYRCWAGRGHQDWAAMLCG